LKIAIKKMDNLFQVKKAVASEEVAEVDTITKMVVVWITVEEVITMEVVETSEEEDSIREAVVEEEATTAEEEEDSTNTREDSKTNFSMQIQVKILKQLNASSSNLPVNVNLEINAHLHMVMTN
jgi:hypothetical protein